MLRTIPNDTHASLAYTIDKKELEPITIDGNTKGFNKFSISPKLPTVWNSMALRNIKAFNHIFDVEVKRKGKQILLKVFNKNKMFFNAEVQNESIIDVEL